jgi:iron complex outermembrane receptor protein
MFKHTKLCTGLVMAFGGLLAVSGSALAQETQSLQRVEVTGSSIKRIAAEASLPVQTFSQEDIKRTGVTSVTDFVQQLPVMQGFTVSADSVGGGGGGLTTASIHDVGSAYTLVLLNGRRMAPATSGTTIDINSIPLSAIDRVEVLTDGASALYGADAIAGVVNFILKKGAAPFTIEVKADKPQHPGAGGRSITLSKGFGDIDADGYSLFVSASSQKENRLKGADREFASTGIINFNDPKTGTPLQFFNGSSRSIPPNVTISYVDPVTGKKKSKSINPYLQINGKCAPSHVDLGDGQCYFDYTTTVEIAPEIRRDGLFASGSIKLGNSGFKAFGDLALNDSHVFANIAPYPAEFALAKTSPLFAKYVQPYLSQTILDNMTLANVKYRLLDMGGRAYDYQSKTTHAVAGIEGVAMGWDINSALTVSRNNSPQNYVGGFPLADKFATALAAGTIDPFPYAAGQMPAAMVSALNATGYSGEYNATDIKMTGVDARASREIFRLSGGAAQMGIGADYRKTSYTQTANKAVANAEILFDDPQSEFDLNRKNYGAYAELLLPFSKQLELTTSVRFDAVSKVEDVMNHVSTGTDESATTYKVSARYQPSKELLFRAAYGTGFKVASMLQIAQPQTDFGVTGGTYECPLNAANGLANHPLAQYCDTKGQLEEFTGGNPDLKPERSTQWTLGAVFEPTNTTSIKLDLWHVSIKDAVTSVDEALIAADPNKYISLYTTKYKASTNSKKLAIILAPINIGRQENSGLDYDFMFKMNLGDAKLTNRFAGTYLFESRYTTPGTDDSWETSLGQYGSNAAVSFRNVFKLSSTYDAGSWGHTLTANYRDGYKDKHHDIDNCAVNTNDANQDCVDVQLNVPAHYTFDWQTQYRGIKNLVLTGGVFNLADKTPPLSLRNTGSHQLGYDPRYASPIGRTFYVNASYQF